MFYLYLYLIRLTQNISPATSVGQTLCNACETGTHYVMCNAPEALTPRAKHPRRNILTFLSTSYEPELWCDPDQICIRDREHIPLRPKQ